MLTIQFLEDASLAASLAPQQALEKLRKAADLLPITHVLFGWHTPRRLEEACRSECERLGIKFMRWHPLLAGDAEFKPNPRWQTVGFSGRRIGGYRDLTEFTLVCPNNPQMLEDNLQHVDALVRRGVYQGFFLDRVRFPSPFASPADELGCFCTYCRKEAYARGFSLGDVDRLITSLLADRAGVRKLVRALFGRFDQFDSRACELLTHFFHFRCESIAGFLQKATAIIRQAGLEIGLDCFSPCLEYAVGQNLDALGKSSDWIKIMSYVHAMGPAGLPFELSGLFGFLAANYKFPAEEIVDLIQEVTGLPLPVKRQLLEEDGLSPQALFSEVQRGVSSTLVPILAGIELVGDANTSHLNPVKIEASLQAVKKAGPAGIAISWDLARIPEETLKSFASLYHALWM